MPGWPLSILCFGDSAFNRPSSLPPLRGADNRHRNAMVVIAALPVMVFYVALSVGASLMVRRTRLAANRLAARL